MSVHEITSDTVEVEVNGRSFFLRPVGLDVLESKHMVAEALSQSLGQSFPWAVGFFFGDVELSLDLWTVISGVAAICNLSEIV